MNLFNWFKKQPIEFGTECGARTPLKLPESLREDFEKYCEENT